MTALEGVSLEGLLGEVKDHGAGGSDREGTLGGQESHLAVGQTQRQLGHVEVQQGHHIGHRLGRGQTAHSGRGVETVGLQRSQEEDGEEEDSHLYLYILFTIVLSLPRYNENVYLLSQQPFGRFLVVGQAEWPVLRLHVDLLVAVQVALVLQGQDVVQPLPRRCHDLVNAHFCLGHQAVLLEGVVIYFQGQFQRRLVRGVLEPDAVDLDEVFVVPLGLGTLDETLGLTPHDDVAPLVEDVLAIAVGV